jgi:hypothetical protein
MSRLWDLALNAQAIDPQELRDAVLAEDDRDYRTRLLMRESAIVLREKFAINLTTPELEPQEKVGFPSLWKRVTAVTRPDTISEFLREVGSSLNRPTEVVIGGSSSLILQNLLSRPTEDVDVVDGVPEPIRQIGPRLESAEQEYALHFAHFQSHYLPDHWQNRLRSLGDFGRLRVFLVDGLDIFLGKLFSNRDKDKSDLRFLKPAFDKDAVAAHFAKTCRGLASEERLLKAAQHNWYVLYGDPLPIGHLS